MNVSTYSEARAGLKDLMDRVCQDHVPTLITRQRGEHVVLMSLSDYNSIQETMYLLSSVENVKQLSKSIDALNKGLSKGHDVH